MGHPVINHYHQHINNKLLWFFSQIHANKSIASLPVIINIRIIAFKDKSIQASSLSSSVFLTISSEDRVTLIKYCFNIQTSLIHLLFIKERQRPLQWLWQHWDHSSDSGEHLLLHHTHLHSQELTGDAVQISSPIFNW